MQLGLFLTGGLWVLAARTAADHGAAGMKDRFHLDMLEPLLGAAFLLFLLLIGFGALHWIAARHAPLGEVNGLPPRASARSEWAMGAALGWGLLVAAILPMALLGDLRPNFWTQPRGFGLMLVSALTLLVSTLVSQVVFQGYLFKRLIAAIGPTLATLAMSCAYAGIMAFHPQSTRLSVLIAFFMGLLFALAYLRTHALWLGWGLHFAWAASMGVLFGLPVGGVDSYASVVDASVAGPDAITGGLYGPEGALFTLVVVLLGMFILYLLTRDLAWQYTHPPIVAAGYAVDVAPPSAHTAMEQAAKPAPLVQILSTTPSASSTMPAVEEHLRSTANRDDVTG
jgi:membrane protease YdiL (CAAX protease family)